MMMMNDDDDAVVKYVLTRTSAIAVPMLVSILTVS
jgi:hypothetical protein